MAEATQVAATVANNSTVAPMVEWPSRTAPRVGRALADHHDGGDDRRLQDREPAEHSGFREQVGRCRQPDRLLTLEDGAFADQVADGQRGAHERRGRHQQGQDLRASSGVPAFGPGRWNPLLPGTVSDSEPRMNGKQRQEDEVGAVGDDQADLPPGDRRNLAPHTGMHRFAQVAGLVGLVRHQFLRPLLGVALGHESAGWPLRGRRPPW